MRSQSFISEVPGGGWDLRLPPSSVVSFLGGQFCAFLVLFLLLRLCFCWLVLVVVVVGSLEMFACLSFFRGLRHGVLSAPEVL